MRGEDGVRREVEVMVFELVERTSISVPPTAAHLNVWLPLPLETPQQRLLRRRVDCEWPLVVRHDHENGNPLLHLHVPRPPDRVSITSAHTVEISSQTRESRPRPAAALASRIVHGHQPASGPTAPPYQTWEEVLDPRLGWTPRRLIPLCIARSRGVGVLVEPQQRGERIPAFVTPYCEIDGSPVTAGWQMLVRRVVRAASPRPASGPPREIEVELASLLPAPVSRRVARGGTLTRAGVDAELCAVTSGRLRLVRQTRSGRRLELDTVDSPGFLLASRLEHAIAEALDDCEIVCLSREHTHQLVRARPDLACDLLGVIGDGLASSEDRLEYLAYHSVISRVCLALLRLRRDEDGIVAGVSHQELGDVVGAHRETVTKALRVLVDAGAIDVAPRRISVLNPALLAEYLER